MKYQRLDSSVFSNEYRERGKKKELLVLQEECARYRTNWKLADGPANADIVAWHMRETFDKHGAPLLLKQDGDTIFQEQCVVKVPEELGVGGLTSPPRYSIFNGEKERSMRGIKSYTQALFENRVGNSLEKRIAIIMYNLNDERPGPVLKGMTAAGVFN